MIALGTLPQHSRRVNIFLLHTPSLTQVTLISTSATNVTSSLTPLSTVAVIENRHGHLLPQPKTSVAPNPGTWASFSCCLTSPPPSLPVLLASLIPETITPLLPGAGEMGALHWQIPLPRSALPSAQESILPHLLPGLLVSPRFSWPPSHPLPILLAPTLFPKATLFAGGLTTF